MQLSKLFFHKTAATSPRQFTFSDWKQALMATKDAFSSKRMSILAAGIAYFMTLAVFPLIAASIAIAGFVIEPAQIKDIAMAIEQFLPSDIAGLVNDQLDAALTNKSANTLVAIVAILIALFSVSGAVQNAISASNAAYDVSEDRNFIKLRLVSLEVLGIFLLSGLAIVGLMLLNADTLKEAGIHPFAATLVSVCRWVVLPVLLSLALACFYRYGPNRQDPKWQWVSWGSVIAASLWFLTTVGFFIYARYFANFSESYGAFAGLVVLMTWLNLSALVILLGAEVNHRLEQQTTYKTTKK